MKKKDEKIECNLVKMIKNEWKWMKMNENEWKWMKMNENEWKWMKMNENEWKWMKMNENEWNIDNIKIIQKRMNFCSCLWIAEPSFVGKEMPQLVRNSNFFLAFLENKFE